jgi:hypothetical protein
MKRSKHYGDITKWITTVIDSCEKPEQLISANQLVINFRNQLFRNNIRGKDLLLNVAQLESRIIRKKQSLSRQEPIINDYLQGFIDQFGDGPLSELNPKEWDALEFLNWLKLNNFKIIK